MKTDTTENDLLCKLHLRVAYLKIQDSIAKIMDIAGSYLKVHSVQCKFH